MLDLPLQANVIYQHGIYLSERSVDDFFVALYQVYDFYVEVYLRFSSREIIKFISFHSDVLLEPYLSKIQLNNLFDVIVA